MLQEVEIYSDGGCRGNPGYGAWAAVIKDIQSGKTLELGQSEGETTNNRMELNAALQALIALKRPCRVRLYSDSSYLVKGMNEWLAGWKKRGYKKANRKPVENSDLWRQLDEQNQRHSISWNWVKGHSGVEGNEACDKLLNDIMDEYEHSGEEVSHRKESGATP